MSWQQVTLTTNDKLADSISDLLTDFGALCVSFTDAEDAPLFQINPNETPLWNNTTINALFNLDVDIDPIMQKLQQKLELNELSYENEILEEQDWVRQSQENFPPLKFGHRLWVLPSWCDTKEYDDPKVVIDPGLAFGTGTHPTTALCLEWLAEHPLENMDVLDYGCGSGILSLAALALGANTIWAVDHDGQALQATQSNAELNQFDLNRLKFYKPEQLPEQQADLILANILSNPLIQLAPELMRRAAPHARLILSGLYEDEADKVVQAYAQHYQLASIEVLDGWARLELAPSP